MLACGDRVPTLNTARALNSQVPHALQGPGASSDLASIVGGGRVSLWLPTRLCRPLISHWPWRLTSHKPVDMQEAGSGTCSPAQRPTTARSFQRLWRCQWSPHSCPQKLNSLGCRP